MYVSHLVLHDFRSYADVEVVLDPGATAFIGSNGQGKTNLVEAIDYLSRLTSHRVATDAPLVRAGADQAVIRAAVVRDGRTAVLEVEINPGRANRARVNKSPLPKTPRPGRAGAHRASSRPRTSPWSRATRPSGAASSTTCWCCGPRGWPASASDYERILRQRNSLLKTAGHARRGSTSQDSALSTLGVWNSHLARVGAEILAERLRLVDDLRPYLGDAYATVARGAARDAAEAEYKPSFALPDGRRATGRADRGAARGRRRAAERRARPRRLPRRPAPRRPGPHPRPGDDGTRLPVRGYASHGESWSFALALRLASYDLLRADGDDPILVLDDVFAELDIERRAQLAELVAGAEQVLVTAAVDDDVPEKLAGTRFRVSAGAVTRVD